MEHLNTQSSSSLIKILSVSRMVMLLGSVLVALSSGTNYMYSAYAPQLGARLRVSHTTLNIIGLAGNMGVNAFGPVWGRVIDSNGPRIPLISASFCLLVGYMGIKQIYDGGTGNGTTVSTLHLTLTIACNFMTGLGGSAGLLSAINTTAKSFPSSARATTIGLVQSGFGLSAFCFSLLAHTLSGDTSNFLLVIALGTAIPVFMCLFIVKPVPLPRTSSDMQHKTTTIAYDSIQSGDDVVESQGRLRSVGDVEVDVDSAPLLSHRQKQGLYSVPALPSAAGMNPPTSLHDDRSVWVEDGLLDIHGKQLWLTPDFYLAFIINGICGGIGLMYMNNVGSIAQALYAKTHTVYNDIDASKWQAAQVSTLSLANFTGRILIGLISDFAHTRLHISRAYCLCIVSSLFTISQMVAMIISSVETLWIASLLLGLAYGSLFGSFPTILIEWFGMAHFTENWGYVCFSLIIGGNLFSLVFGRNWDSHVSPAFVRPSLGTRVWSSIGLTSRELVSEHWCLDGKACYLASLQVTLVACIVSLGLSLWAGIRGAQKIKDRGTHIRV